MSSTEIKGSLLSGTSGPRYLQNTPEVPEPTEIPFSGGRVPSFLINRSLYSSAPGVFDLKEDSVSNWFDGYAILSKFSFISEKEISFCSKYLGTRAFDKARKEGKPVFPEFGTPPLVKGSFLGKLMPFTPYDCTDNVIGPIFKLAKEDGGFLYTSGDSCYFHKIHPGSLETVESLHTYKTFGMNTLSQKGLLDEEGNFYLVGATVGIGSGTSFKYSLIKGRLEGKGASPLPLSKSYKILNSIPSRWIFGAAPIRHFALTPNFIVLVEMPLVLSLMRFGATYAKSYRAMDWLEWKPEESARLIIFNKTSGQVVTEAYSATGFFFTFIINAYEDGVEAVVMDLVTMPNLDSCEATLLQGFRERKAGFKVPVEERPLDAGSIQRYKIPLGQGNRDKDQGPISPTVIIPPYGADFCAINPKFRGRRNKFIYITAGYMSTPFAPWANGVAKVNVEGREIMGVWRGGEGQVPSSPVFIPNTANQSPENEEEEEDGVIVTLVKNLYSEEEKDFLVVIDGKTMEEVGRAEFPVEVKVAGWAQAACF